MKLLRFLELQRKKKPVGTLALGKTSAFREIFFEKDRVFLCAGEYTGRIDMVSLQESAILDATVPTAQLEKILLSGELRTTLLPQLLEEQGLLNDSLLLDAVAKGNIREELLDLLLNATESFAFQEGRVPEALLDRGGVVARISIPIAELIDSLRQRINEASRLRTVLPAGDEVFVVTAEGMQYKQTHPNDFALQRLLGLIDGLRDLDALVNDTRFYEFFTLSLIEDCLDKDILKKTIVPELRDVSTSALEIDDAAELLPYFKNAVKHSVDQLSARERLAVIHEKLGQTDECVVQYNFIGDALYRMRKPAQAIQAYHKALTLKPDETLIVDKITRIYCEAAEEQLRKNEPRQAAQLLRNALRICPDDWQSFEKLTQVLASHNEHKELQELCERLTQHAKDAGDPMIAVKAYRIVLPQVEDPSPFQRSLVNVYLDFGEPQAAATLMRELIGDHLDNDEPEKALEFAEKIYRIGEADEDIIQLRKQLSKDLGIRFVRAKKTSTRVAVTFFIVALALAYQVWSYVAWSTLEQEAVALAANDEASASDHSAGSEPAVEDVLPNALEQRCLEISERCADFQERFPISLFRSKARDLQAEHDDRAAALAEKRETLKNALIQKAQRFLAEGDQRGVTRALRPLLELDESNPWQAEAVALARKGKSFQKSAQELFRTAEALQVQNKHREAYAALRELLDKYPTSKLVKSVRLPVLIESVPSGCHVFAYLGADEKPQFLGVTPLVRHMSPGESFDIELSAPGHESLRATLYDSDGLFNQIVLRREPLWSERLDGKLSTPPVLHGDRLILGFDGGRLQIRDVRDQKILGAVRRQELYSVQTAPVVGPRGVYSVWNDGTIVLLPDDAGSDSPPGPVEFDLPKKGLGMPKTTIASIGAGEVVVGTSRKKLLVLDADTLAVKESIPLPGVPVHVSLLDPTTVVAASEKGHVVAVSVSERRTLWTREIGHAIELAPTLVGPSLVTVSSERRLFLLDPSTGLDRKSSTALRPRDLVRVDREGQVLYLLSRDWKLATISPKTGAPIVLESIGIRPSRVVSLAAAVGLVHHGDTGVLVLDSQTLKPRWAVRSEGGAFVGMTADARHLIGWTKKGRLIAYPSGEMQPPKGDSPR